MNDIKIKHYTKSLGIGLLELMLSLAIISILLIMAVRYYQSANTSQQISAASDMISAVRSAMKNYHNDNPGQMIIPSVNTLVTAGYLPTSYKDGSGVNPFGGTVGVSPDSAAPSACASASGATTKLYYICLDKIPSKSKICPQLASKIGTTVNSNLGEAVSGATSSNADCTTLFWVSYQY